MDVNVFDENRSISCTRWVSLKHRHAKNVFRAYADSEDQNQTARTRSLIGDFAIRLQNHLTL